MARIDRVLQILVGIDPDVCHLVVNFGMDVSPDRRLAEPLLRRAFGEGESSHTRQEDRLPLSDVMIHPAAILAFAADECG
ncbi:hypothetical protein SDC9_165928 [bioreactor metagenome]|uniref:Uncharacterized protein n=1 Tax=bioreactor metagenome TaxID=1076179 RepID=A0A645FVM7_9ZZZZ